MPSPHVTVTGSGQCHRLDPEYNPAPFLFKITEWPYIGVEGLWISGQANEKLRQSNTIFQLLCSIEKYILLITLLRFLLKYILVSLSKNKVTTMQQWSKQL